MEQIKFILSLNCVLICERQEPNGHTNQVLESIPKTHLKDDYNKGMKITEVIV
jgi:hypothetical protein